MSDNNPMSQMWGNNQLDDAMTFFNFNNGSSNSNDGINGNNVINNDLLSNDISMPIINDSNNTKVPFNNNDQLNMNINFGTEQAQTSNQNLVQNAVPNQSQNNQKQQQQLFQQLQQQKQQQQQFNTLQSRKTSHSSQHSHSQVRSQVGTPKLQHDTMQYPNLNLIQNTNNAIHSPVMSNQTPRSTQQQQQQQQQQQPQRKVPVNTQLNQQNTERFLDLVEQYMKKINKPFNRYPVIGGIKINLFVYYYVVTCIGGFIKAFQDQKFPFVANQLGIPVTNQKLYNDFLQTYYSNLLPFEQYARTADGMKDAQRRQNQLAQQQLQQQQQQKQQQQLAQKIPVQSQEQTPSQLPLQLQDQLRQHQLQQQQLQQQQLQLQQQQLQLQQQQLQLQQKMQQKMQQKIQQVQKKTSEKQAQVSKSQSPMISEAKTQVIVPNKPQIPIQAQDKKQTQIIENAAKLRALSNVSPHTTSEYIPLPNSKLHNKISGTKKSNLNSKNNFRTPDIIKNYLPYTIIQDKPGGVDILNIERLGEELDDMKPVFLYFPELGRVDIKALALSISSGITAEINVALNVLLIISSDPNIQIPFDKCMILLESLSLLGKTIVEKLALFDSDLNKTKTKINDKTDDDIDIKPKNRIDAVFEKYSKLYGDKDYTIQVDSFTSQIVFDNSSNENKSIPDIVTIEGEIFNSAPTNSVETESTKPNVFEECSPLMSAPIEKFNIPSYLNMLHECRSQADDIDSNIYAKCYIDKKLVLLEELSTISLIFRNLSFSGNNNTILATNNKYLDFIFTLLYASIAKPEIFIYSRKRLSFMKDIITIFSNIIHSVEFRTDMEMWLIISLAFAFSTSINDYEKKVGLITSKVDPVVDKYHAHAVDILSKSIYSSLSNKNRFSMILTGKTLDTKVSTMVKMNFGSECFENGSFIKSVYSLFISILPINIMYQGIECFNELFQTCLESLLSCLGLTDILESSANIKSNVALDILMSPERFGMILQNLSFVYAAIYVNVKDNSSIIHPLLSARCAELSNKLIKCAINYAVLNETVDKDISRLRGVSRLLGNTDNLIGMLMTTKMPAEISEQVVESLNIYNKLERLIN